MEKPAIERFEEEQPYPPRFRWLRRLSFGGLLVVISLPCLRGIWGWETQRRVRALIAEVHSRNEPITPQDFAPRHIADANNAAILIRKAMVWSFSPPELDFLNAKNDDALLSAEDLTAIRLMLAAHSTELSSFRKARSMPDADWGDLPNFGDIGDGWATLHCREAHQWFSVLRRAAIYEHEVGNDFEALEFLADLRGAERIDSLDEWLSTVRSSARDATTIRTMVATLSVGKPGNASRENVATREQVRALIDALLDDRTIPDEATRESAMRRMLLVRDAAVGQNTSSVAWARVMWPMFQLGALHAAERCTAIIAAVRQETFPAADGMVSATQRRVKSSEIENIADYGVVYEIPPRREVVSCFECIAERRIAAVAVALRLYVVDHNGNAARTLDDLVPNYLPRVPDDPFSAAPRPLGYRPHDDPPSLYSVGLDGIDNGGDSRLRGSEQRPPYDKWEGRDAVFPLHSELPATAPAE